METLLDLISPKWVSEVTFPGFVLGLVVKGHGGAIFRHLESASQAHRIPYCASCCPSSWVLPWWIWSSLSLSWVSITEASSNRAFLASSIHPSIRSTHINWASTICDTVGMKLAKQSYPCFQDTYSLVDGKRQCWKDKEWNVKFPWLRRIRFPLQTIPLAPENEIGDGAAGTTLHQLLTPLAFNHLLFKISCRHQTCPEVTAFVSFLPSGWSAFTPLEWKLCEGRNFL